MKRLQIKAENVTDQGIYRADSKDQSNACSCNSCTCKTPKDSRDITAKTSK